MKITVVAHTQVTEFPESLLGTPFADRVDESTDIDYLAELTGRSCYKSWKMPNPDTATNQGYLSNIIEQGHFSVLEHGSVTLYVEGVSRALLLELERHRFTSYSVESQRFVNTKLHHPEPVIPPAFRDHPGLAGLLQGHYDKSLELYDSAYNYLRDAGLPVKKAREAARSFLLESTPVDLFVTANLRAWRDIMGKRWSTHADEEIQEFAGVVLDLLRTLAPNSLQDVSSTPSD
jgi:thymidylate synthase (FAD)